MATNRRDFLAPTPSVRQPLFETSEICSFSEAYVLIRGGKVSKVSSAPPEEATISDPSLLLDGWGG